MTVFKRLLNLYRKSDSLKTPMEDFCTECLAGILQSDSKLLQDFALKILKIESDTPFRISTQHTFNSKVYNRQSRIDLVFQSDSVLCFIEMKVNSTENERQLEKYAQILNEQPSNVSTYLRYCTLYNEEKIGLENFEQFRWADIAKFLVKRAEENKLIREFYNFLKAKNMAGNERFNHEDLVGLKVYSQIAKKVDAVFNEIKQKLAAFGSVSGGLNASSHILEHNRWALLCKNVIGDNSSEVLVSFDFVGMRYSDEPVVAVQLFVHQKCSAYKNFVEVASERFQNKKYHSKEIFSTNEHGAHIRFEKPLALFFSEMEQLQAIQTWMEGRLDEILDFRNSNLNLDWKF